MADVLSHLASFYIHSKLILLTNRLLRRILLSDGEWFWRSFKGDGGMVVIKWTIEKAMGVAMWPLAGEETYQMTSRPAINSEILPNYIRNT